MTGMTIDQFCSLLEAVKANLPAAAPEGLPEIKQGIILGHLYHIRRILAAAEHLALTRSRKSKYDANQTNLLDSTETTP